MGGLVEVIKVKDKKPKNKKFGKQKRKLEKQKTELGFLTGQAMIWYVPKA